MKRLFDLRFIIGSFFTIVGLLLFAYCLMTRSEGRAINQWCGGIFLVFGIVMIFFSTVGNRVDEVPEA